MIGYSFTVEHCAGKRLVKIADGLQTSAVSKAVTRCEGCGLVVVLTTTMRVEPRRQEPELPLPGVVA